MRLLLIASAALCGFSATAMAQNAPAAAATVAKHTCVKAEYPGRLASDSQMKSFNKRYDAYKTCIKAYVEEQNALVKAHTEAANGAIEEFNAVTNAIKAEAESK